MPSGDDGSGGQQRSQQPSIAENAFAILTQVRDYELNLELNYTAQIIPGLVLAPDPNFCTAPER
jgi:hypothetical protein